MWFMLPEGAGGVCVERQQFECEIRDSDGRGYFRAPDHFAPTILNIPGFALAEPPEGAPEDLPRADPLRDGAIADLTKANESLKLEVSGVRADLASLQAELNSIKHERDELASKLREAEEAAEGLREQIEDKA